MAGPCRQAPPRPGPPDLKYIDVKNSRENNGKARETTLPRHLVNAILDHVRQTPGKEACGLIAAREGRPCRCYPIRNIAVDATRRFEMDPREQIAAFKTMRTAGETLFAIYHSHPAGPACPSPTDIAAAAYPEAIHLIVSLDTAGVLEMRGYRIRDGQVEEVSLTL